MPMLAHRCSMGSTCRMPRPGHQPVLAAAPSQQQPQQHPANSPSTSSNTVAASRRGVLSLTVAGSLASAAAPAVAATEAFCGVVPYVPPWAFSLPWNESIVPTGTGDPVWLRKVGQEPSNGFLGIGKKGAADKLPLLVVHGGPGLSSQYLETLEILCAADRRVSFYDQSGCGNTLRANERGPQAPALLPLYLNELEGVAQAIGYPRYHVLGDGWGGILAATAAAAGRLPGAVSCTLLNTAPSYRAWIEDRRQRALQLPGTTGQELLRADDGAGTLLQAGGPAAQAYLAAVVCHRAGSSCLFNTLQETAVPVAQQLSGGYMFKAAGELEGWELPKGISLPVLMCRGEDGDLSEASLQAAAARVADSRTVTFARAGNCMHIDASELFLTRVDEFMLQVEAKLINA